MGCRVYFSGKSQNKSDYSSIQKQVEAEHSLHGDQHQDRNQDGEQGSPEYLLGLSGSSSRRAAIRITALREARPVATARAAGAARAARATIITRMAVGSWAGTIHTRNNGNITCLTRCISAGGAWIVGIHVCSAAQERLEYGLIIGDLHGAFQSLVVRVDIRLVPFNFCPLGRVVALDLDLVEHGVVIAIILDIFGVPVHKPTSPLDCAVAILLQASRPKRYFDPGRGLRVFVQVGGLVPSV